MQNIGKWPNFKRCYGVNNRRSSNYLLPFFKIIHERLKLYCISLIRLDVDQKSFLNAFTLRCSGNLTAMLSFFNEFFCVTWQFHYKERQVNIFQR